MTVAKLVPLIGLALAGAAWVFLGDEDEAQAAPAATKPTPKPTDSSAEQKPGAGTVPPPAIVQRVMTALATMDPVKIRAEAAKLEAEGFKAQADDLRKAADLIQSGQASAPTNTTPIPSAPPPVVVPPINVTSPGVVPPSLPTVPPLATQPQVVVPGKQRAATLALHLKNRTKGKEDKSQVEAFQVIEAIDPVDGLYGTATGLVIAERYGIVPPKPFYFGTKVGGFPSVQKDKDQWKARMVALAKADPQRADEWIAAGKV